jgi:hypothetical protein
MKKNLNTLLCFFSYLPAMYLLFFVLVILMLVLFSLVDSIFATSFLKYTDDYLKMIYYVFLFSFVASVLLWVVYFINLAKQPNISIDKMRMWRRYLLIWFIFANAAFFDKFINKNETAAGMKLERFKKFLKLDFFLYLKPPD